MSRDGALADLVARAHAAWPELEVDGDALIEHVARHAPDADEARLGALPAGDLYLALACGRGDAPALRLFEERLLPPVQRALGRFGDASFAGDVLQELRLHLFVSPPARILEYAGTGSLAGWIKVTAVRMAIKQKARAGRHAGDDDPEDLPLVAGGVRDAELDLLRTRYRARFEEALREELGALDPAERTLLRFYVLDRLNIGEIGHLLGMSRATVGRRVIDVREKILEGTRRRLADKLAVSPSELESILRMVRTDLDMSLSSMLGPTRAAAR